MTYHCAADMVFATRLRHQRDQDEILVSSTRVLHQVFVDSCCAINGHNNMRPCILVMIVPQNIGLAAEAVAGRGKGLGFRVIVHLK